MSTAISPRSGLDLLAEIAHLDVIGVPDNIHRERRCQPLLNELQNLAPTRTVSLTAGVSPGEAAL